MSAELWDRLMTCRLGHECKRPANVHPYPSNCEDTVWTRSGDLVCNAPMTYGDLSPHEDPHMTKSDVVRPLHRLGSGHWQSSDRRWTFGRMESVEAWFIWGGEAAGDYPVIPDRFATLRDAVAKVESWLADD